MCANFVSNQCRRGTFSYRHLTALGTVRHPNSSLKEEACASYPDHRRHSRRGRSRSRRRVRRPHVDRLPRRSRPALRRPGQKANEMDVATTTNNATILRTLVTWADVAPTKPANAAELRSTPAYNFDDLDEFVRNAQPRDTEVLMTLWGTPKWANGDKGPQLPPDLDEQTSRTSPRRSRPATRAALPAIRSCASTGSGTSRTWACSCHRSSTRMAQIVSPAAYAKLAAAGYAGIKAGNPKALVAIGETSSNGRDKKKAGASDSVAPGHLRRGSSRRRTRSSSSTPGPSTRTPCR